LKREAKLPFELHEPPDGVTTPLLCHVPHSATDVPARWRDEIALPDAELRRELVAMTDHLTDALFVPPALEAGGAAFVNRISRLVCDPERFEDDRLEGMSKKGMGAVYTRTSDGRALRSPGYSPRDRETVLREIFRPYAEAFEGRVSACLRQFGRCLIIDAHSFPSRALPYEDASLERPDLCLGTDAFHTPAPLVEALEQVAREAGWRVAVHSPFAGSYVPTKFFGRDSRVVSAMIEVNRSRYLDERTAARGDGYAETAALVGELVQRSVLFEAFRNTTFVAFREAEKEIRIRVGEVCAQLEPLLESHAVDEWVFVTAYNPDGKPAPQEQNLRAQARLAEELDRHGLRVLAGEGRADVGTWPPEPSMLILGMPEPAARDLGRRYGQAAIVVGRRGRAARLLVL